MPRLWLAGATALTILAGVVPVVAQPVLRLDTPGQANSRG